MMRINFPSTGVPQKCAHQAVRSGLVFSTPLRQKSSKPQRSAVVYANPVLDAGKYLAEAAKQIFSPTESADQPPWDGSGLQFSGNIKHHESSRLRAVYEAVKSTRQAITGCTDPAAVNYDPSAVVDSGLCNYIADEPEETGMSENLGGYMSQTISRVFSNNFKGDETEPDWGGNTGYSYRGQRVSQRDITRLLAYEKVVKKTLDKAEAAEKEAAKK